MKGSLKLQPRRALNHSEAWACFIANLALPGSGSLVAGRVAGYFQLAAAFLALIFSMVTTIPMSQWVMSGGASAAQSSTGDPLQQMSDLWRHARWPLVGIGLYAVIILWAMTTSLAILAGASKDAAPPHIH